MKLYGFWRSLASHRVRIALNMKGLPFDESPVDLLQGRQFADDYRHGLVVFDREGSGREHIPVDQLQNEIRQRMAVSGWDDRAEVVVLDPELEVWVFAGSPDVERCLGWRRRRGLRNWLQQQGLWEQDHAKPARPKEALETALRAARRSRSSMYECLGSKVGVAGCIDPAFLRLRQTLMEWSPRTRTHRPAVGRASMRCLKPRFSLDWIGRTQPEVLRRITLPRGVTPTRPVAGSL